MNKLLNGFLWLILKLLASKKLKFNPSKLRDVVVDSNSVEIIYSTNVLCKIPQGYFRPLLKYNSRKEYIKDCCYDYFALLETPRNLRVMILESIQARKSLKYLWKVLKIIDDNGALETFADFFKTRVTSESEKDVLKKIAKYLRACVMIRSHHSFLNGKCFIAYNANRMLCTEAIANLIGVGRLIPHSEIVVLNVGGRKIFGTLMQESSGIYPLNLKDNICNMLTPSLQRDLLDLNLLDTIDYEFDHKPGNYNVILSEDGLKITGISVFDNDCHWTFFPSPSVSFKTYDGAGPLIYRHKLNRPCLNPYTIKRIMSLKKSDIDSATSPYLNLLQRFALKYRLCKLKNEILKAIKSEVISMPAFNEWDYSYVNKEMTGNYGSTYLTVLVNRYNFIKKNYPWVLDNHNIQYNN